MPFSNVPFGIPWALPSKLTWWLPAGQWSVGLKHGTKDPTNATTAERRGKGQGQKEEKLVLLRYMLNFLLAFFSFPHMDIRYKGIDPRNDSSFIPFPLLSSLVCSISPSYQKPAVTKMIEFGACEIFIKGLFFSSGFL